MLPAREIAKNRWPGILSHLGVSKDYLRNRHGPCPMCGGKDRFRFDDKGYGRWFCNQCGSGDGVELVKRVLGLEFKDAVREIEKAAGVVQPFAARMGRPEADVLADAVRMWSGAKPVREVEPVAQYWINRVGQVPTLRNVRGVHSLPCPGMRDHPAMLALIRHRDTGRGCNVQRLWLDRDGNKAHMDEPRRVMQLGLPDGCAVRLMDHQDVLGVAEGIETAVAAWIYTGIPCWSLLNAQNMVKFIPPDGVRKLVIFGDNDTSHTGQSAAYELSRRMRTKNIETEVRIPEHVGQDWCDVLIGRRAN